MYDWIYIDIVIALQVSGNLKEKVFAAKEEVYGATSVFFFALNCYIRRW